MPATVWRGRLAFGMVAIPVRLHKAARRERIRFHRVYRAPENRVPPAPIFTESEEFGETEPTPKAAAAPETVTRVRNLPVVETDGTPVEDGRILKGYEIEKDRYVTFEPRELAALRPETSTEFAIGGFVRVAEIDPVFFETSYYAVPDSGGETPYALLFQALSDTGYAALGRFAMHGREHAAVVRPGRRGLIVHTLFFSNEVRAEEEYRSSPVLVAPEELELARTLVLALAGPFDPAALKDTLEERVQELIQSRAKASLSSSLRTEAPKRAPVVDIMEALRKSLEMARKPPTKETGGVAKQQARRRRSRR